MPGWPVWFTIWEAIKKASDKPNKSQTSEKPWEWTSQSLESAKKAIADKTARLLKYDNNNKR